MLAECWYFVVVTPGCACALTIPTYLAIPGASSQILVTGERANFDLVCLIEELSVLTCLHGLSTQNICNERIRYYIR